MKNDVIIIVRHGKPSLKKVRVDWLKFRTWWEEYDRGGIIPDQKVPDIIYTYAKQADVVISSPLLRAVESATLARGGPPNFTDKDLIEAALPSPNLGRLKLHTKSWGTLARILWYCGWSDGMESHSDARVRAEKMADKLGDHAAGGKMVFVMAHGWFNRMLKGSLKDRDWKCVKQNGDLHWSHRRFERPASSPKQG